MAAINIATINTTANQDVRLASALARVNADRAAQGQAPFADVPTWGRAVLISAITDYIKQDQAVDTAAVDAAYSAASPAVQATVRTALGLP